MKEGFDISKIKIKSTKEPNIERKLTDEVITSLDPNTDVKPNAEIEKDEYVRFPDGTIQLAAGNKHEQGGIKVYLPDGTQVLTNNLKLTKDHVTEIKDEYGLNLSTKDTYAVAMKKFDAANGITKLNDEQEELFKELKKLQDRQKDGKLSDGDHRINHGYLSEKINKIEKEKESKLAERNDFFTRVFEKQETLEKPNVEERRSQNMKYGGVSEADFKHLCRKHGISEDVGRSLLNGVLPSFDNGGEKEELQKKLNQLDPEGKYRTLEEASAAFDAGELSGSDFDNIEYYLGKLNALEGITPETTKVEGVDYEKPAGAGVRTKYPYEEAEGYSPKGVERLNKFREKYGLDPIDIDSDKASIKKAAGELQSHMGENYPELVYDYMTTKSHKPNNKLGARLKKLGYESTNEGLDKAINDGKLTKSEVVKDYQDNLWWYRALDTEVKKIPRSEYDKLLKREGAIKQGDELFFAEDPENPELYTKYEPLDAGEPEVKAKDKPIDSKPIVDDLDFTIKKRGLPYLGLYPEQRPLPPSPMEAHLMGNIRLGRIDPIRIGIEDKIQASHDRLNFTADQVAHLPPEQQAIVLANAQAIEAKGLNDAIIKTNMVNAQNQASAELFNIGQSDREEFANLQNRLSFEERQLTAKAKTQEEFRNYFKELKRQRAERFRWDQNVALLQEMTPDVSLNAWGTGVDVHPTGPILNDWRGFFDVGINPYSGETA